MSALTPAPTALLIGASSGIGEALARKLAQEGYHLALVARRAELLEALCAEINTKHGAGRAQAYTHDVTHYSEAPALFQKILADLGRLDLIVYNAGVQFPVKLDEYDFAKDQQMMAVNALGAMAWLNLAAQFCERAGGGHIVGVSSVAGDRGRVGAPGLNTSKAALSTFLEALRNRLTRKGVHVLTVKPGMVATEMLKAAERVIWVVTPEQVANDVWKAIRARQQVIYTPARWGLMLFVIRNLPSFIFRRLKI